MIEPVSEKDRIIQIAIDFWSDCIEDNMLRYMETWDPECKKKTIENFHKYIKIHSSKFEVGDWIINDLGLLRRVQRVDPEGYQTNGGWLTSKKYEDNFRLWTLNDARPGDILVWDRRFIGIYKCVKGNELYFVCSVNQHDTEPRLSTSKYGTVFNIDFNIEPATETECNLLATKLKESNLKWDSKSSSLIRITNKFKVGDRIKKKDQKDDFTGAVITDIDYKEECYYLRNIGGCIPFSIENDFEIFKPSFENKFFEALCNIKFNDKIKNYLQTANEGKKYIEDLLELAKEEINKREK